MGGGGWVIVLVKGHYGSCFSSYQFAKEDVRLLYSLHLLRIKQRSSKSSTELA